VSFTEFPPTERDPSWIPAARAVGVESDREYGLAVLRELDAEMGRRSEAYKDAGVTRFADLRQARPMPRVVGVIDECQVLLQGTDRLAREAVALLESLARKGRSYGIHLILASQTIRGVESLYAKRDSIFGQFPVRVALPGGGDVLDPLNQAGNVLGLGQAVVNTAGGLGGPAGASRAHERLVEFPDPHAEPEVLTTLRHKLWNLRHSNQPPNRSSPRSTRHCASRATRSSPPVTNCPTTRTCSPSAPTAPSSAACCATARPAVCTSSAGGAACAGSARTPAVRWPARTWPGCCCSTCRPPTPDCCSATSAWNGSRDPTARCCTTGIPTAPRSSCHLSTVDGPDERLGRVPDGCATAGRRTARRHRRGG